MEDGVILECNFVKKNQTTLMPILFETDKLTSYIDLSLFHFQIVLEKTLNVLYANKMNEFPEAVFLVVCYPSMNEL